MQSRREAGQVLPLIGVLLAVLLGFTAYAVDAGYLRYEQRIQQQATDSAALAGATELLAGTNYQNAAGADAAANGFADNGSTIKVVAVTPPTSGAYTSDANAVQATITAQHSVFFANIWGIGSVQIATRAVATRNPNGGNGCIYLLDSTANTNFNKGTVLAPTCGIVVDGTANFSNTTITAASIGCVSTCSSNGASFPLATPGPIVPASDPCTQIAGCTYLKNNPPSTSNCTSKYGGSGIMYPGCYSGTVNFAGKNVTFNPGLYIITGSLNSGGNGKTFPTLNATGGVTFYLTNGGTLNFNNTNMNLTAPTTGDYSLYAQGEQNVLFYDAQTPTQGGTPTIQSAVCGACTSNLSGLLYFPYLTVNYNKSTSNTSGSYALLVFGSVNWNKSTTTFIDGPSATGPSLIRRIVLAE